MEGKEQIVEKILQEASDFAESTVLNAKNKADENMKDALALSVQAIAEGKRQAEELSKSIITKKQTVANIDGKKAYLGKKQEIIDGVYDICYNSLLKLSKKDYIKYITDRIEKYATSGDTVIISENAPFDEKEIEDSDICKKLSLKVIKNGKFGGGLILSTKTCDKNMSFEATVKEVKDLTEAKISSELWK